MTRTVGSWELTFLSWRQPLSDTEELKCSNAERIITAALKADPQLASKSFRVVGQGSYANNTNVRRNSDIDLCVILREPFFSHFEDDGYSDVSEGYVSSSYSYSDYKNEVYKALLTRFGKDGVSSGGKAFVVKENSYRIDTDVVPCMEYRLHRRGTFSGKAYDSGVKFITSSGKQVVNFPEQHIANGRLKNISSNSEYKKIVRIIKKMRYEMIERGIPEADGSSSFLIECAVYNVPNIIFQSTTTWYSAVLNTLTYIIDATSSQSSCDDWTEVNGIKWLFKSTWAIQPPLSREQAHEFFKAARRYIL